jgi:hypothetical protein
MLADTEALDEYFANKYFKNNAEEFLNNCHQSVYKTENYLKLFNEQYNYGEFISTSFLNLFGSNLHNTQTEYVEYLSNLYKLGNLGRIDKDIEKRQNLYCKMYGEDALNKEFLAERTIRTMGQYLALGRIIGEDEQGCIIVHDTVNASLFQSFNKFTHNNENNPTSPVIRQSLRVY